MAPTNLPQTWDGRSMPTPPTLQAEYTGYNDLQHLSQHQARDNTILQALETVTDKYHLLANLTNSPSNDLNIPKFLHWVLTAISDCSDLVTAFLNETPKPQNPIKIIILYFGNR